MALLDRIKDRSAVVGIVGLGYVGLPLLIEFGRAGFKVIGFDIDSKKTDAVNEGRSYIKHIAAEGIREVLDLGKLRATTDFTRISDTDCIIICVPTPLTKYREPDLSYVLDTTETIARYMKEGQLISLESTTYPGTTDEDMRAILEAGGLKAGVDFHLAFSPEREDPNNGRFATRTIPKIVGGYTPACLEVANALYSSVIDKTVPVSSTRVAEAAKLLENIYRAVNIALVNELKVLFDRMDIDVFEVIDAAKTKPFGFQAFYPGPGLIFVHAAQCARRAAIHSASDGNFHHQKRDAQRQHRNQKNQKKCAAAVSCSKTRKTPYISEADCRADRRQYKRRTGTPLAPLHCCLHTLSSINRHIS